MNKIIQILIMCLIVTNIYADVFNTYDIVKEKEIEKGSEINQLGWDESRKEGGGVPGPKSFTISKQYEFFIPDVINRRISIFNKEFDLVNSIIVDKNRKYHFSNLLKTDKNGNILIQYRNELSKLTKQGDLIFDFDIGNFPHPVIRDGNFFPIDENVIFYNKEKKPIVITQEGFLLKETTSLQKLNEINTKDSNSLVQAESSQSIVLSQGMKLELDKAKQDIEGIIIGDRFFSSNFSQTQKYFEKIKNVRDEISVQKSRNLSSGVSVYPEKKKIDLNIDDYYMSFIGYDNDHNGYWHAEQKKTVKAAKKILIVIFSRYGELLDAFQFGETFKNHPNTELFDTTWAKTAIAPNGDVWFMKGSEKGHTFWKVERQW